MTFAPMTRLDVRRPWMKRPLAPGHHRPPLKLAGGLMLSVALLGCPGFELGDDRLPSLGMPLPLAQLHEPPVAVETLPEATVGQGFTVEGLVTQVAPLGTGAVYELQDATGGIWILAAEAPSVGATVRVQGQLSYETILVGGQDRGEHYLQEQQRTLVAPAEDTGDAAGADVPAVEPEAFPTPAPE
ncbi:MAG: hypothetical protein VKJ09_07560 [Leptolyngbya sp.]|nr:hypothetical protein [Leptolyngbya sp.]